ncbi:MULTISPECIES: hypothetical protein [unclassified Pseudomonas]|uniref:hypothetical protein n=1 Tax=unclassified Pseudomonas TaxID=196821 RepID=UPI0025E14D69|nr:MULTISPECIES: hypothetical protein [unclassified Pseudomonas]
MSFYEDNVADGSHGMSCCGLIGVDVGYPRACRNCGGEGTEPNPEGHTKRVKAEAMQRFDVWLSKTGLPHKKHNNGFHVVLTLPDGRFIDVWPSTKKWQLRGDHISRNGKALHGLVLQQLGPWS